MAVPSVCCASMPTQEERSLSARAFLLNPFRDWVPIGCRFDDFTPIFGLQAGLVKSAAMIAAFKETGERQLAIMQNELHELSVAHDGLDHKIRTLQVCDPALCAYLCHAAKKKGRLGSAIFGKKQSG